MPGGRTATAVACGGALVAVGVLARSGHADAQTPIDVGPVQLVWVAPPPPSCPRGEDVVAESARILRGSTSKKRVVATALVEPKRGGGWRVAMTTRVDGAPGE